MSWIYQHWRSHVDLISIDSNVVLSICCSSDLSLSAASRWTWTEADLWLANCTSEHRGWNLHRLSRLYTEHQATFILLRSLSRRRVARAGQDDCRVPGSGGKSRRGSPCIPRVHLSANVANNGVPMTGRSACLNGRPVVGFSLYSMTVSQKERCQGHSECRCDPGNVLPR